MQNRGAPGPEETRNLIIAFALIMVILFGFQFFYARPQAEQAARERAALAEQQAAREEVEAPREPLSREESLAASSAARVTIDTNAVDGTILLEGARIDDLNLRNYRRTMDEGSPEVTLLEPFQTQFGQDVFFGWEELDRRFPGLGARDLWTLVEGDTLAPNAPIVLSARTGDGLEVTRTIRIDEDYMFTITDAVRNVSGAARQVRPFGVVRRHNLPDGYRQQHVVHQGMVGVFGSELRLRETKFEDASKFARDRLRGKRGEDERIEQVQGAGGWLGITDHYWMTAIVVAVDEQISAYYNADTDNDGTTYRAAYRGAVRDIPAGGEISYTQRLFAGAKRVDLLRSYQSEYGIPQFDKAVDWGNFWFLTRPVFYLLDYFGKLFGQFGVAILAMTVVIKILLFPLVYQSFSSMAKMRAIQPKMKEIQERYKADPQRMQQEQMRLFQTEKVNPLAGCMPLLLQFPVFFALYKVLTVTIEMRHAPFFGWIDDLSARDPTSLFNLFGLLPYDPTTIPLIGGMLAIGVWPILNGVTMWTLQHMSPPPTDPIQAKIFQFLPIVYVFFFSGLAAGLVIYYTWSNALTIAQQYFIMRRQGVETQFDMFLKKHFKKDAPAQAE